MAELSRQAATGPRTVILHWNGSGWQQQTSPNPAGNAVRFGVVATSAGNAWAVGGTGNLVTARALILHWNGHAWR
jgi:hypothetical protein